MVADFTYWMNELGRVMGECGKKEDCIVTNETVLSSDPNNICCYKCGKLLATAEKEDNV